MYYNDMVALPMALLIIQARLENRYYRTALAVKHDARLLAANAATFNGAGSSIARLAEREFWALPGAGGRGGVSVFYTFDKLHPAFPIGMGRNRCTHYHLLLSLLQ